MLQCSICGVEKPQTDFYGHHKHCKVCRRAKVALYREKNALKIQAYDLMRLDDPRRQKYRREKTALVPKDTRREYHARYLARHPEKRRAHIAVGNALRDGRIQRPTQCVRCNAPGPVEAHHEDYGRPLDVLWFCRPCHLFTHKQEKRARVLAALVAA